MQKILSLPQIEQQTPIWYQARRNKQSASDFGAVVPRTSEYIQHIVDRWQSKDLSKKSKYCYDFGPDEYYLRKIQRNDTSFCSSTTYSFKQSSSCATGNQFETIIRNITAQHLHCDIVEMGWVEGQRSPHAGVSPDGLLETSSGGGDVMRICEAPRQSHSYFYDYKQHGTSQDSARQDPDHHSGYMVDGCKNFEAKTIVSRPMIKQVPLKYHIQVERTAYELGVESSIYSEARFTTIHEKTWRQELLNAAVISDDDHLIYGLMLASRSNYNTYMYPPMHLKKPEELMQWVEDTIRDGKDEYNIIYFRLDAFWCVEIPLWHKYDEVYGPLILREADKLHWFATTEDGKIELERLHAKKKQQQMERAQKRLSSGKTSVQETIVDDMKESIEFLSKITPLA